MIQAFDSHKTRVILLDIEGTTTPIDFVYRTLFPFARRRVKDFLARHATDEATQHLIGQLRAECADAAGDTPPLPLAKAYSNASAPDAAIDEAIDAAVACVYRLMDEDRKSTPLKELQGRIWEAGYLSGELLSQVFADVPPALARWRRQGRDICIYSSGSVLAQRLLFTYTEAGDLTRYLSGYFDTNTGGKREAESYRRIAAQLGQDPAAMLFVSDVTAELAAARAAGVQTVLCLRPGNAPQADAESFASLRSFEELAGVRC